ncbi:MAG: YolD-like family protein [Bacilli bacterium]|nr:YolD-like family protein [Bacilli bacterium]
MQDNDFRAKQFMPFDSLKGFYDMIKYQEINIKNKKVLSDDTYNYLNEQIKTINKGEMVTINYYHNIDYINTTDIVKKIDNINKKIYLKNSIISFSDIIDIKII